MTRTTKKKNAAKAARANRTAPAPKRLGYVEADPNRLPAHVILRGDYNEYMRSLSSGKHLALGAVGVLVRVVATYLIAQFALRFAVMFGAREGHLAFAQLAQDAASQGADLNMLMNQTIDVTAIGAALGAVLGVVGAALGWHLVSLAWWLMVTRSRKFMDVREGQRESRRAEREANAERGRARRIGRKASRTNTSGSTTAESNTTETVEDEVVSTNG